MAIIARGLSRCRPDFLDNSLYFNPASRPKYRHILFDIPASFSYARYSIPGRVATPHLSPVEDAIMFFELPESRIVGPGGALVVPATDEVTPRLLMLLEGQCEGLGAAQAAAKYGLTRQRYYQLLKLF